MPTAAKCPRKQEKKILNAFRNDSAIRKRNRTRKKNSTHRPTQEATGKHRRRAAALPI